MTISEESIRLFVCIRTEGLSHRDGIFKEIPMRDPTVEEVIRYATKPEVLKTEHERRLASRIRDMMTRNYVIKLGGETVYPYEKIKATGKLTEVNYRDLSDWMESVYGIKGFLEEMLGDVEFSGKSLFGDIVITAPQPGGSLSLYLK